MGALTLLTLVGLAALPSAPSWKVVLDGIATAQDRLEQALNRLHSDLRKRLETVRPDLVSKLDPEARKPKPSGYRLLPELAPDVPEVGEIPPVETRYSLPDLADWVAHECGATAELAAKVELNLTSLERLVDSYLVRRENLRRIEAHVGYHALWQPEATRISGSADSAAWLAHYRAWRTRPEDPELRRQVEEGSTGFTPNPGLRLEPAEGGWRALRLPFTSDIEDQTFLAAFEQGVEHVWNDSDAMKAERLRIDIVLSRRPPADLYPEGAPSTGVEIDRARHLERFPADALVLTTGGASTHVWGRAIFLGGGRTTCRTLAHELAHLVGFADRYLRVVDGPLDATHGATFLEIVPFPSDLMSSPGGGRVTPWMVRKLIEAYESTGGTAATSRSEQPQP